MPDIRMAKRVRMLLAVAMVALVIGVAVGPGGLNPFGRDATTGTVQGDMLGGGSWSPVPMDRVVTGTDLVVRAVVADVEPTRVANPDGKFRPIDSNGGPHQLNRQHIETPVKLKVLEVVSRRPESASHAATVVDDVAAGKELMVTIAGGRYEWTLTPEDARALGIMAVEEGPDGSEQEVEPTEPMPMTAEVRPMFDLREGQEVVAFLSVQDESWRRTIRIVGQGAFVLDATRTKGTQASGHAPPMKMDEIRRYAEAVTRQGGRAATGDELQR